MFQQFRNMLFNTNRHKVADVMYDIDLFYGYLKKNNTNIDEWYFRNVFTENYCRFLRNFSWLNRDEIIFLHRGVLSLLLFKFFRIIENGSYNMIANNERAIEQTLIKFNAADPLTEKLRKLTLGALKLLVKSERKGIESSENQELIRSVTWTLRNIVLTNEPSNNIKNER